MLGQGSQGHHHGGKKHGQLDVDDHPVALLQLDGEINEQRRCPQHIQIHLGAVVVGEEPEEDGQKGDDGDEDEESAVEPTHVP